MVTRGEIWWSEGPDWGGRPVLVLTRHEVAARMSSVLVAMVTQVVRDIPTEVALDEDDGMPRACVVNLDNLSTEPVAFLVERVTRLGPDRMGRVCRAITYATGC